MEDWAKEARKVVDAGTDDWSEYYLIGLLRSALDERDDAANHACDWKLVHASDYVIVEWCRLCGALKD